MLSRVCLAPAVRRAHDRRGGGFGDVRKDQRVHEVRSGPRLSIRRESCGRSRDPCGRLDRRLHIPAFAGVRRDRARQAIHGERLRKDNVVCGSQVLRLPFAGRDIRKDAQVSLRHQVVRHQVIRHQVDKGSMLCQPIEVILAEATDKGQEKLSVAASGMGRPAKKIEIAPYPLKRVAGQGGRQFARHSQGVGNLPTERAEPGVPYLHDSCTAFVVHAADGAPRRLGEFAARRRSD